MRAERADTGSPTLWYEPPADAQPPEWPSDIIIGTEAPTVGIPGTRPARLGRTEDDAPTFYFPDVLSALVDTIDDAVIQQLNSALATLGMSLTRGAAFRGDSEVTLMLSAATGDPDAWQALRHLRSMPWPKDADDPTNAAVEGLALRRLYITGMPAKRGHAGTDRAAVTLLAVPPRSDPARVPGGRRPVVAVIDSGVGRHHWLEGTAADPFWLDARNLGWTGAPPGPATNETVGVDLAQGVLESHTGHGTFITGLIRQIAPDARVLSIYAMSGSGVLDETVVLDALTWLRDRCRVAADPAEFVDIINLSFGYYEHAAADTRYTRELRRLLGELGSLGVQVVASAGNDATSRPVFPAAFADPAYSAVPDIPLISVGALNPDGSHAEYSNVDPTWTQHWEPGTAVTSTVPPFGTAPGPVALAYNPNDLIGGFAQWSGTSFAAGVASARLARALSDAAADNGLLDVTPTATSARMRLARKAIGVDDSDEGAGHSAG
jgi:hypothetical protein